MLSCLSCVRSVLYVLGGLVELEPREYNCGLRYLTVSCEYLRKSCKFCIGDCVSAVNCEVYRTCRCFCRANPGCLGTLADFQGNVEKPILQGQ